ncbi:hypothetical protein ETD86_35865 [Nonomuraea turkmeniaca]|uniref:Aminoglycoside phosphotransferase domain-containing protein n=1 Tax=Nonomuraea turkmeniaca TaxID=103838 RepID=A0A5S4FQ98_9ACTN|nr:hypothetical protein ETD86_35865 [Nonomuraea turkmeniaca]
MQGKGARTKARRRAPGLLHPPPPGSRQGRRFPGTRAPTPAWPGCRHRRQPLPRRRGHHARITGHGRAPLGRWQADTTTPDLPWLSGHQLAQRIAASDLNWTDLEVHPRIPALWEQRGELLKRLSQLPHVLVHGDFSQGNLRASEDGLTTLVLDWATPGDRPGRRRPGFTGAHHSRATSPPLLGRPQWPIQDHRRGPRIPGNAGTDGSRPRPLDTHARDDTPRQLHRVHHHRDELPMSTTDPTPLSPHT